MNKAFLLLFILSALWVLTYSDSSDSQNEPDVFKIANSETEKHNHRHHNKEKHLKDKSKTKKHKKSKNHSPETAKNLNFNKHKKQKLHKNKHHNVKIGHKQSITNKSISIDTISKTFLNFKKIQRKTRVSNIPDHWEKIPHIFQTYNEPEEEKWYLMPALSNGFIGTTVKNSSIYVNGLYNGLGSQSHRVRIPSLTAMEAVFITDEQETKTYNFDCRRGVYTIETKRDQVVMQQKYYVHRRLKNIIVNEIRVELKEKSQQSLKLINFTNLILDNSFINSELNPERYNFYRQENNPENISYEHRVIKTPTYNKEKRLELNDGIYQLKATIPITEISGKRQKQIHMYYTNVPEILNIYSNTTVRHFHFIQAVDSDFFRAKNAFDEANRMIQTDPNGLFNTHIMGWEEIWKKSGLAMVSEGNYNENNQEAFKLAQRLYASFYNLYSSLPMIYDDQFYGISASGLSYGGLKAEYFNITSQTPFNRYLSEGYGGHVTYHQELWILPLISLFNVDMSRTIINSRLRKGLNQDHLNLYEQARELAREEQIDGIRYPWSQGDYGVEVNPYQNAKKKIHTSADISFGLRSFLRMTHSKEFLAQSVSSQLSLRGEDYLLELAKYWFDKFELNSATKQYDIKDVYFGEKHQIREVNNEAFTNYMGSLTMDTYKYALMVADKNPYDQRNYYLIRDFDDRFKRASLPFEEFRQLVLEYENFAISHANEETFVPFLNYPVQKHFSYAHKKNIYDTYANQLPNEGKNVLSYASYMVGYTELNEEQKSRDYLKRISTHFNEPFQVLSEYPQSQSSNIQNPINTFNYLPGYAAFAQGFIGAYCGFRAKDYQLDIVYPSETFNQYQTPVVSSQYPIFKQPVPNMETWNITGVSYRGNKLDFLYNLRTKSVEIRNMRPEGAMTVGDELEIISYEGNEAITRQLRVGDSIKVSLATDQWKYLPKRSRLQQYNSYSNNMNILASIYSTRNFKQISRPNSANTPTKYIFVLVVCLIFQFKFSNPF